MLHCFRVIQFIVRIVWHLSSNKFTIGFIFIYRKYVAVFQWNKHLVILIHRSPAILAVADYPVLPTNGTQCIVRESGITLKIQYGLVAVVCVVLYQTVHAMLYNQLMLLESNNRCAVVTEQTILTLCIFQHEEFVFPTV